jgi:hypothetical protein
MPRQLWSSSALTEPALNGLKELEAVLVNTEYGSVVAAVAAHARFLHPEMVRQTAGSALFPIVRWQPKAEPDLFRRVGTVDGDREVVFDDNTSPRDAFLWAAGLPAYSSNRYPDYVFTHIWDRDEGDRGARKYARDPDAYTALWNVCATPAFLAKTTDTLPEVREALRFHAYKHYGARPAAAPEPKEPNGYSKLPWRAWIPARAQQLEDMLRDRLNRKRLNVTNPHPALVAAREIGWLFSGGKRDLTVGKDSASL